MKLRTKRYLWLCLAATILASPAVEAQVIIIPKTQRPYPPRMHGQYMSPRQYMRRLGPNVAKPPPPQPGPARTPAAAPIRWGNTAGKKTNATSLPSPVPPPLPVSNVSSEKERQSKETALKKSIELLKQRAEAGSASAQYELRKRYMTGNGVEKDLALARKWLEASAKQGEENAKLRLAELDKLEGAQEPSNR